ncbi:uncharacterized protein PFL1_00633 [Pseudozyma flocculosa PF-1]|uniref:Uncharacterized protein n=1 Tax=Pseudozyma flocculosa TaxID=84751 RepID=A0A5C3EU18_9BASI|nr:uncharacterized protein PFL1_00633 [Pseudozyma flocculosa PF-1]EPQ32437.1 hypothetical protein PFL1_00633 [Pseudozyma flocculosa PF-1]SPO34579.1 uncharacterized protein PSFLO_00050 [Pseudozyma flocculosa]
MLGITKTLVVAAMALAAVDAAPSPRDDKQVVHLVNANVPSPNPQAGTIVHREVARCSDPSDAFFDYILDRSHGVCQGYGTRTAEDRTCNFDPETNPHAVHRFRKACRHDGAPAVYSKISNTTKIDIFMVEPRNASQLIFTCNEARLDTVYPYYQLDTHTCKTTREGTKDSLVCVPDQAKLDDAKTFVHLQNAFYVGCEAAEGEFCVNRGTHVEDGPCGRRKGIPQP